MSILGIWINSNLFLKTFIIIYFYNNIDTKYHNGICYRRLRLRLRPVGILIIRIAKGGETKSGEKVKSTWEKEEEAWRQEEECKTNTVIREPGIREARISTQGKNRVGKWWFGCRLRAYWQDVEGWIKWPK